MYLDAHDLNVIATGPPGQGAALLKNLDAEIVSLKRTVCDLDVQLCLALFTVTNIDAGTAQSAEVLCFRFRTTSSCSACTNTERRRESICSGHKRYGSLL